MPAFPLALIVGICFLVCSAAVLELTLPARRETLRLARIGGAALVLALNLYFLVNFAMGGLSGGALEIFGPKLLGRPSAASAFNFVVAAAALMMPFNSRGGRIYSGLIAAGLAVTGFDFAGYAYDIAALSRTPTVSAMSMPTMM